MQFAAAQQAAFQAGFLVQTGIDFFLQTRF
jgi:hypothetical protein